uniref:Minor capsid protein L2 n=1 Tax=human papillomavirus 102 TaxID=338327 RepID=A0A159DSQ4_9PAPI|nr:L2 [human papillomavirus 102]
MSTVVRRRKRASATDLYRTCKAAGTCPPDVIPKVEGDTWADRLLKWASLGVFFGRLGIGTSSGTGGRTGYIPLGTRPPTVVDVGPTARPPVVIEPVGAGEPSIVQLVEDSSVIEAGATVPTFTGTHGFEVTSSSTTTPAVLDITPSSTTVQVSSTSFTNPLFTEPSIIEAPQHGDITGHVFTSTPTSGTHGFEEIPMQTFGTSYGTGQEPISSTPIPGVRRVAGPRIGLYSRATDQVKVSDSAFISRPGSFVTYDNPVFDPEETIIFEHPSLHAPPDPDFLDIVALHRPALTTKQGAVRVSRIGQRATLRTRSGKRIGARVHFYHDISPIAGAEHIELRPLQPSIATAPGDSLYDIYADNGHLDSLASPNVSYTSSTSVPLQSTNISATSVVSARYDNVTVPLSSGFDLPAYTGPDIPIATPTTSVLHVSQSSNVPSQSVFVDGTDYFLLPNYLFFPKKRKRVHYSFADGFVATW